MYEVFDDINHTSHGTFITLGEAMGCVEFDRLTSWRIVRDGLFLVAFGEVQ
jgi:hypothetical protein